ncbi:MAG TPA: phosphoglycolate phosphatase [Nitrososphaeraceae archaeon]|nr:phosphoglycolate phosphatase [Nitrososphaeraceae archaeon]
MGHITSFAIDIDGTITENGGGMLHLPAILELRILEQMGFRVIYVTGRSSFEAYTLAVFAGTTKISVAENGGVITKSPQEHLVLGDKKICMEGYNVLKNNINGVKYKEVFSRMSEVVLCRNFDIVDAQRILDQHGLGLYLSDSKYAFHINQRGINKSTGLIKALQILGLDAGNSVAIGDSETDIPLFRSCGYSISLGHAEEKVKHKASTAVDAKHGEGLVQAIQLLAQNFFNFES